MLLQEIYTNNLIIPFTDLPKDKELAKQIQTILIKHDILLSVADGLWGDKSETALKEFITVTKLKSVTVDKELAEVLIETKEIILLPEKSIAAKESEVLPFNGKVDWQENRCYVSKYFTVGEVIQNDSRRIPRTGSESERNILKLAKELDKVREAWGYSLGVSSWNRPEPINHQVGGIGNSKHTLGIAADIYPLGGGTVYDLQKWLDIRWKDALGYGAKKGFVHLDIRGEGGLNTPGTLGKIRWVY